MRVMTTGTKGKSMRSSHSPALRRMSTAVLMPVALYLVYGPFGSSVVAAERDRRARLMDIAQKTGIPAEMLLDPEGWQKKQDAQAKARRQAALAGMPSSEAPQAYRDEVASIRKQQALHTLVGATREANAGHPVDSDTLSPEARTLYDKLRASKAHKMTPAKVIERPLIQPLKAKARQPVNEAPKSWQPSMKQRVRDGLRKMGLLPTGPSTGSGFIGSMGLIGIGVAVTGGDPANIAPTVDAQSDHPLIRAKATALGNDPVRIYNFVHDTIVTELYYGSKKGAVGTLREGRGNDYDQASLLVALLRAAGVPAKYEIGNVALTPEQSLQFTGTTTMTAALTSLSWVGIPVAQHTLGPNLGRGLKVELAWVQAFVAAADYRGIARDGSTLRWVSLAPSIKKVTMVAAVDLRDAALFDEPAYLAHVTPERPVDRFEAQVRAYIQANHIDCQTLDSARPVIRIVPDALSVLPADLAARRVDSLMVMAEIPAAQRHRVDVSSTGNQDRKSVV